jgi:tRNA modification GTPase
MSVVFALATPPAKSAICVFRVSGDGCHSALSKVFSGNVFPPNGFSVETLRHKNRVIDKVGLVVLVRQKAIPEKTRSKYMLMVVLRLCLI